MSPLVYPHTRITADLASLAAQFEGAANLVERVRSQYLSKKDFYVARIAELESQVANAQVASPWGAQVFSNPFAAPAVASVPYPHTNIQQNLGLLRASLEDSSSPERQTRLDLLASVRDGYAAKRTWFSAARMGNTTLQYPHTNVQGDIDSLRESLEESSSPQADRRLELLDDIESDYLTKRNWFSTLPGANSQ